MDSLGITEVKGALEEKNELATCWWSCASTTVWYSWSTDMLEVRGRLEVRGVFDVFGVLDVLGSWTPAMLGMLSCTAMPATAGDPATASRGSAVVVAVVGGGRGGVMLDWDLVAVSAGGLRVTDRLKTGIREGGCEGGEVSGGCEDCDGGCGWEGCDWCDGGCDGWEVCEVVLAVELAAIEGVGAFEVVVVLVVAVVVVDALVDFFGGCADKGISSGSGLKLSFLGVSFCFVFVVSVVGAMASAIPDPEADCARLTGFEVELAFFCEVDFTGGLIVCETTDLTCVRSF